MAEKAFCIVKFVDEDDAPGIIPTNWIIANDDSECLYPSVRTEEKKDKMIKQRVQPDLIGTTEIKWISCPIKILHKYDTYAAARLHLRTAEETSDLTSDDEIQKPRRRKQKDIVLPGEENSDDSLPTPRLLKQQKSISVSLFPSFPSTESFKSHPSSSCQNLNISKPALVNPLSSSSIIYEKSKNVSFGQSANSLILPRVLSSNSSDSRSDREDYKWDVMQQWIADMTATVSRLEKKVDLLLANNTENKPTEEDFTEDMISLGILPLQNYEDFLTLEESLKENKNLKAKLLKVLVATGGRDVRAYVANMMRRIMNDPLAQQFALTGKSTKSNDKKAFVGTEICRLLFRACQKVYKETDEKIKEIVGDFLHQAKTRLIRKEIRKTLQMNSHTGDIAE